MLLRHPNLRVVLAESALSWGMLYLEWADHQFEHDGLAREGYELNAVRNVSPPVLLERVVRRGRAFRPYVGAEHILWSTNFPLATSTWPRTHETIDRCFQWVSAETREKCSVA